MANNIRLFYHGDMESMESYRGFVYKKRNVILFISKQRSSLTAKIRAFVAYYLYFFLPQRNGEHRDSQRITKQECDYLLFKTKLFDPPSDQ